MTRFRIVLRIVIAIATLAGLALITGIFMLRTDWFRNVVREKIISTTEQATGGRVEIGKFDYDWKTLTANVAPFTLHGTEPEGERPFFHAEKVQVSLKIISVLNKRVDLAAVVVERPEVRITVDENGHSNLPTPKLRHLRRPFVQELLQLKIRNLALHDGFVEFNSERVPLDIRARNLDTGLRYEASGPRYAGEVSSSSVIFDSGPLHGAAFQFKTKMAIENNRLLFADTRLAMQQSSIELSGALEDFASPHGIFDVKAVLFPVEVARAIKLPIENRGQVGFSGKATFSAQRSSGYQRGQSFDFSLDGHATGTGLAFVNKYVSVSGISLASPFRLTRDRIELNGATVKAMDSEFRGRAEIRNLKTLLVDGSVHGFSVEDFPKIQGIRQPENLSHVSGTVNGPVHLESFLTPTGLQGAKLQARLDVLPGSGGVPVQGFVDVRYEQTGNTLQLANTSLTLGSTHAEVSGTLGDNLTVRATSRNLNEVLVAFPLFGLTAPKSLPAVLNGGTASFEGNVAGPLKDPRFTGHVEATRFSVDSPLIANRNFDRITGNFDLSRSRVFASTLDLDQGGLHLQGSGTLGLTDWIAGNTSSIAAKIAIRGAELKTLLAGQGSSSRKASAPLAISGLVTATGDLKGTVRAPSGTAHVEATDVSAFGERADRVRADVTFAGNTLEFRNARVNAGKAVMDGSGSYQRQGDDWTTGALQFDIATHNFSLAQSANVRKLREGVDGQAQAKVTGTARLVQGDFHLETLASEASIRNVVVDEHAYGNVNLTARTKGPVLDVRANGNLRGTPLEGYGEWKLEGDYPGHAEMVVPRMTIATLHGLMPNTTQPELPFEGFVEGKVDLNGPLKKPDQLKAEVRLSTVQINASQNVRLRAGAQQRDLVVRNSKPVLLEATTRSIDIKSAEFAGPETTIEVQGRLAAGSKSPWDVRVNGSINLAILQLFNPDLLASGNASVNSTLRGAFSEPEVSGQLVLKNASLYLTDLPNGLDQANGLIFFDKNRATVNQLTAMSGGGRIKFQTGSFVGFRGGGLVYRVQGSADHVRYRSPEGVSITVNAAMSLLGTSDNSVLSGTVTVMKAGFNPKTDIGSLLATTARPVSTQSIPNPYLRGIQYDIRVESAASLEIETSLTRNIEAEANVRVRGTLERPVVLGNLSVNEGEIEFFGNKYNINRGDVNFYNTVKIEPIIDMDLETVVRGVTVDIAFSGPLNKLNFSYRSDPPLQTNDIIALLAVGRAPSNNGRLGSSQTVAGNSSYFTTGSNALLGQAISAPVAGRLQRFFGVSHLKIDPQLTDLTSIPQARVTLEQQISKDVTLTYITNLTRTQEQIIRVEWDLNRQWSLIALRDENGAFGVDFQFRKRFK
ncbi:MAG: translocation/assembly module TamB domain-containing protein [Acidobacteriota bacterium]|nr:translocation/assembly module TamB domain-containing protein [Acidobacteriota bacterium]